MVGRGMSSGRMCGGASAPDISLGLVVAIADGSNAIGKNGGLLWDIPEDMAHFRRVTTKATTGKQNAVIMGRVTWDSIPPRFRPLKGRINVVVSRNPDFDPAVRKGKVFVARGMEDAVSMISELGPEEKFSGDVYVIGGEALYKEAIAMPLCKELHITRVFMDFQPEDYDRVFPAVDSQNFRLRSASQRAASNRSATEFQFETYERY
eukprot:CAMPEP_0167776398 /NCGR_PEP_ID=MMETSP0111_2-20121227/3104_1 /TAXON_ID=91324 /ORGANISM="Lotharella globosa, Strain CCCM811" /LENGTH=206 /DNA_ID=CAMNT_0007666443 /DNA_START=68 /DNA_END=688 /DNA_ORIENTATION=-